MSAAVSEGDSTAVDGEGGGVVGGDKVRFTVKSVLCGWCFFLFCIIRTRPSTKGPFGALHAGDVSYGEGRGRTLDGLHSRTLTKEIRDVSRETAARLLICGDSVHVRIGLITHVCMSLIAHLRPVDASALFGRHHGAEPAPHVKFRNRPQTFSYMVERASS